MRHRLTTYVLLLLLPCSLFAQDKLLLTNGRYKNLRGEVVSYDYNDIFFQNEKEREAMLADSVKRATKQRALEATEAWQAKQQKEAEKMLQKKAKQQAKIALLRKDYEEAIEAKKAELKSVEFGIWQEAQLKEIKELEQKYEIYWALREEDEKTKAENREARYRSRFTRSKSRSNVFSIIHADGTEEVVYNADTLGLLADGDFEVEYGVEEMRLYIKGRQDGRKHSFHDVYIGAGVGLASGLVFTYTLDMFYAPIAPAICVAVMAGLRKMRPSRKLGLTATMLESDPYMDGYYRSAKGRKIFAFTIGAIGGLGIGIGTGVATSPLLQTR
jgi:hypothetical protein